MEIKVSRQSFDTARLAFILFITGATGDNRAAIRFTGNQEYLDVFENTAGEKTSTNHSVYLSETRVCVGGGKLCFLSMHLYVFF